MILIPRSQTWLKWWGQVTDFNPDHPGPGRTEKIECFDDKEATYQIWLPPQYDVKRSVPYPILIKMPVGGPILIALVLGLGQWVIQIGVNKVSNGMKQHYKPRFQNAVFKDLDKRGVNVCRQLAIKVG